MSAALDRDSRMECGRHGLQRPAFVCRHLQYGRELGFHEAGGPPDPDLPFRSAWCDECHEILMRHDGEWNDESESFARPMAICEGCLQEIQSRNQ